MMITKVAIEVLYQLKDVLSQMTDSEYQAPSIHLSHATIGQHVRHTLEFFTCLQDKLSHGEVNYDLRARDIILESDRNKALETIDEIINQLNSTATNKTLNLKTTYGVGELSTIDIPTNYYRELAYNIEHAVHHMALIKVGIKELCDHIQLPSNFGIASSTVRYHHHSN
ncbi:MAG: DinB family protein [Cyclobacteriaceae bacterium]